LIKPGWQITRSEFVDKPGEFILQFDKNGDCRVAPDEMKDASTGQKRNQLPNKRRSSWPSDAPTSRRVETA
jgi:hypothetical protein